jgi:hypothetical protein
MIAAAAATAVGVAIAFTALVALLRRHDRAGRRADAVAGADPRLAAELREVQAQIDAGRRGYRV